MYFRKKTSAGRVYLQIVESRRTGDQVRQHVIATLGRWDELEASGQLERLLRSGARFAEKALVLGAAQEGTATTAEVRRIGPALVFERLWTESGCRAAIDELAGRRKHGFDLERAVFLTVLHRLFGGGSDRAADRWREDSRITGVDALNLHHLYRAMAWLGEALPETEQNGRTPFALPRTWWKSASSPTAATSSAASIWCSWTPPACPSRAPAGRRSVSTATARTTGPTCAK
jgi:hypothetical protein